MSDKPSTRIGDAIGSTVRAAAYIADYVIPLAGLAAYRCIPERTRAAAFGGPATSRDAMRTLLTVRSNGWHILHLAVSNHPERPKLPD